MVLFLWIYFWICRLLWYSIINHRLIVFNSSTRRSTHHCNE